MQRLGKDVIADGIDPDVLSECTNLFRHWSVC